MPTLYLLCGLPFSGKSTLAKALQAETGAVLIAYDTLWQDEFARSGQDLPFETLSARADTLLSAALSHGSDAIYDTLNDTRDWRDRLRQLAAAAGATTQLLFLDTPLSVLAQRRAHNDHTPTRHAISDDAFTAACAKFEPPTPDENPIMVPVVGNHPL